MNYSNSAVTGDSADILASASKRNFARTLVGDFAHYREREQHRNKIFLARNMPRVLAYHEKQGVKQQNSGVDVASGIMSPSRSSQRNGTSPTTQTTSLTNGGAANSPPVRELATLNGTSAPNGTHDTSTPSIQAMSKFTILASKKDEPYDSGHRRSMRRKLERQHEQDNAHLIIDLCNIRKKLNFKENKPRDDGQPPKKRMRRETIKCNCHLSIWDNSLEVDEDALVRRSEACAVFPGELGASPELGKFVEVKLAEPFVIRSKDLKVWKEVNGQRQRVFSNQYFMEIKIIPNNDDAEWPPIPLLGKSEGDQTTKLGQVAASKLQSLLVARYQHLPHAPEPDTPLSLFYLDSGCTFRTKYGMEVNSFWTTADPGTLNAKADTKEEQLEDWAIDEQKRPFGRHPEPKKRQKQSHQMSGEKQPVKITYYIDPAKAKHAPKEFRKCFLMGFRCPSCPGQKFAGLQALQFHLVNLHHQYKFTLDEQRHNKLTGNLASATFKVESIEVSKPRNIEKPKEKSDDWVWHAPNEPFDIEKYVEGDQSWIGIQNKRKHTIPVQLPPAKLDMFQELRKASGGFLRGPDVPEFRASNKKLHPNVKLRTMSEARSIAYTSISHRQVGVDEDPQSETDDEMENEWFIEKCMENLDITANTDLWTPEERVLRKRWDRHLFKERLPHSRYLSDSLIRFVRAEKSLLNSASSEMMLAFVTMLEELKDKRVINTAVAEDIWKILNSPSPPRQRQQNRPPPSSIPRVDLQQPFTCGTCRKMIREQGRRAVHCTDLSCERPNLWHHARCVGCLLNEKFHWKCPVCINKKGKAKEIMT